MSKTDDSATIRAHVEAWDCTCKIKASCVRCGTLILMDANARQREEIARLRGALAPIVALLESDGPITAKVWPGLYPLHRAARAALEEVKA